MSSEQQLVLPRPLRVDGCAAGLTPRSLKTELGRLIDGGIDATLVTVASIEGTERAFEAVAAWRRAEARDGRVQVCTNVSAIRRAARDGKFAVVLHFQGAAPIALNLDLIEAFASLGVRVMQTTYNYASPLGDGCLEPRNGGLTELGRSAISRMERAGITIDLSHTGAQTCLDILELNGKPVIATHANARSIYDSPRNLSDEVLRGIARSGGVVGLCAFPGFVSHDAQPTLDQLIDHAVYISELVGPQHLSVGTDFADEDEDDYEYFGYDERYYPRPPWRWPVGISWWNEFSNIAPALRLRGFSAAEVDGILGENLLRALDESWPVDS